jgi:hypothetical protein
MRAHVLEHRERGKDLRDLERARDAEPGDLARRPPGNVAVLEPDGALGRPQMTGDHVDEGGLAGAVGADDADGLLRRNVDRDVARRHDRAERLLEIAHRQDHRAFSGERRQR